MNSLLVGGTIRQVLGDLEGHLEGLLVVQARVDERLVALGAGRLVIDVLTAAEDLGDVVAGELDVDSRPGQCPGRRAPRRSRGPRP